MPRPVKQRRVCCMPQISEFAPCGREHGEILELTVDEFETVRLIDLVGLTQEQSAAQMNVARTTVQAIYEEARKKIADALVNGKKLVIRGGSYAVCPQGHACAGRVCADGEEQKPCCRRKNTEKDKSSY